LSLTYFFFLQPFLEIDGSLAVTCTCGAGFCGFCLVDTNGDAHAHVSSCYLNSCKGSYFANREQIRTAQNIVKRQRVMQLFQDLDADTKLVGLNGIPRELQDLGIVISKRDIEL